MLKNIESKLAALKLDEGAAGSILAQMQGPPVSGTVFFARARHMVDPHDFYVLPVKNENILPYIEQPGPPYSKSDLKSGITVIYQKNYQFKRGYIRGIVDNKCNIFAMDDGRVDVDVDTENVFHPLVKEALLAPPLAFHCELYLCEPRGPVYSEAAIDAFKHFMGVPNEKLRIKVQHLNSDKLKVIVHNSNDDVASLLALTDFTQFVSVLPFKQTIKPRPPPPNTFPWKHKTLSVGDTLTVRIQHGSCFSKIFVCTVEDFKDYTKNRSDFGAYCRIQNEISEEDFNIGTPVGVMSERVYERGVIDRILVPKYEAVIRLVDWGKLITVTKDKVRPIRTEMYSMTPVRAFYCNAMNGHEFQDKLPLTLCKGYMYKMTVKRTGSEFDTPYMVTLQQCPQRF